MFTLLRKLFSKNKKKESRKMADEKDVEKKVETEKVETEEKAKVDEKPTEEKAEPKVEEKTDKTEEKVDEKVEEEPKEPAEPQNEVVDETEPVGNGIRIEDVVTKDYLAEKFAALEAKFDAVIKENGDLKEKLSFMEKKYEDDDFGDLSRKGVMTKDKDANSSFDEYSRQFM